MKYIKLLRVKHYLKNGLIFLPLIFSGRLFDPTLFQRSFIGFLSFCAVSSVVYIINDIRDMQSDRNHPTKCRRPIASGAVSVLAAILWATTLLFLSFGLNFFYIGRNYMVYLLIGNYLLINLAYSFGLKNIPIIDIVLLVSGFFLRVLYGSAVTGIAISNWLYLTVISLAFYLGLGKRRNELKNVRSSTSRKVLQFYSYNYLDKNMYVCLTQAIVFYSLWTVSIGIDHLIWTVPAVITICMRYSLIIEGSSDGDPIEVVLKDKVLMGMALAFCVLMFGILYF